MAGTRDRRGFLTRSLKASVAATLAFGFEDKVLTAHAAQENAPAPASPPSAAKDFPMGKIGDVSIGRLICGGNLISGFAHSRDLIYVSRLLKHYFTDEKVFETFRLCETHGINTAILRMDSDTLRIINRYWREFGGNLQWIAQIKPRPSDLTTEVKKAVDAGAVGVYVQGETGDAFIRNSDVDSLGKVIECIRNNNVIAGMGAHAIEVVTACEKAGIKSDFYMKTFNSKSYWSAGPAERHDSVWEETPQQTMDAMKGVEKPWIAFKVLGAGAIAPDEGFKYAFDNGADFVCVGMFDFQIAEDADIARKAISGAVQRARAWKG